MKPHIDPTGYAESRVPIEERYPWRVRCSGCGWIDHFATAQEAQVWADNHPHRARVSRR